MLPSKSSRFSADMILIMSFCNIITIYSIPVVTTNSRNSDMSLTSSEQIEILFPGSNNSSSGGKYAGVKPKGHLQDTNNCEQAIYKCKDRKRIFSITKSICGSDGVDYRNMEELDCVRKSCNLDLTILHEGSCKQIENIVPRSETRKRRVLSTPASSNDNDIPICDPDSCGCSDDFIPICGNDGTTYGNFCLLKCNKKCVPKVVPFHEGYCGKIFFRDSNVNINTELLQSAPVPRKDAKKNDS